MWASAHGSFCTKIIMDNTHKGKRGFVIGGGPSIKRFLRNDHITTLLRNEIAVGVNKAYTWFTPTYLVAGDQGFIKTFWKSELEQLDCVKFFAKDCFPKDYDTTNVHLLERIIEPNDPRTHELPKSLFLPISFWQNSGAIAIRIAYLLGLNPLYLLGFDGGFKKNNEKNFHSDYLKVGYRGCDSYWYSIATDVLKILIKKLQEVGIKIYSCSEKSTLNSIIEYVPLSQTLKINYERE
jgi:hypothetical protein